MNLLTTPILYGVGAIAIAAGLFAGVQTLRLANCQTDKAEAATELANAAASLRGCATSLNSVNEQAQIEIEEAEAAARHAEGAREAAEREAARLAKVAQDREDEFDRRLRIAQRRPECRALLDTDVRAQCGF